MAHQIHSKRRRWLLFVILGITLVGGLIFLYLQRNYLESSALTISSPSVVKKFYPETTAMRSTLCDSMYRAKGAVFTPTSQSFTDVPPTYWAYKQIEWCNKNKIMAGYADGTFKPGEISTRATVAVVLRKTFLPTKVFSPTAALKFTDVPTTYWAYQDIQIVSAAGYLVGYGDGTFRPDEKTTRATFAVALSRATGKSYNNLIPTFSDVPKTYWAYKEIEGVTRANLMDYAVIGPGNLSLSPSSGSYNVDSTFTTDVVVNTGGRTIDAVDIFYLNYPSDSLAVLGIKAGTILPKLISPTQTPGKIQFSALVNPGSPGFSGSGVVATITFKALKATTANVTFNFTPGVTTDCNIAEHGTGEDLLASVINGTYKLVIPTDKISLFTSPSSGTYSIGQTFDVAVKVNPTNHGVVAIDVASLHYPTDALEVVSITPGQFYSQMIPNPPVAQNGLIKFSAIYNTYPSGWGFTIATVKFKVKSQTLPTPPTYKQARVYFDFTYGSTTDSNVMIAGVPSQDSLQTVVNATYNIIR